MRKIKALVDSVLAVAAALAALIGAPLIGMVAYVLVVFVFLILPWLIFLGGIIIIFKWLL